MDKEDYEKSLEAIAYQRNLAGPLRRKFIRHNVNFVLLRSYGEWNEQAATARIAFLEGEQ